MRRHSELRNKPQCHRINNSLSELEKVHNEIPMKALFQVHFFQISTNYISYFLKKATLQIFSMTVLFIYLIEAF